MQNRFRNHLAIAAALACALAGGATASGQTTPDPNETPTPVPISTPVPTAAPTPDENGITPLKQGGVTGNSNGPNWLEKFNRRPEPERSVEPAMGRPVTPKTHVKPKKVRLKPPQ